MSNRAYCILVNPPVGDLHHILEAVFKALGMALDSATRIDTSREGEVPSSKGI